MLNAIQIQNLFEKVIVDAYFVPSIPIHPSILGSRLVTQKGRTSAVLPLGLLMSELPGVEDWIRKPRDTHLFQDIVGFFGPGILNTLLARLYNNLFDRLKMF